jgi:ribose transport system ATP-binding protein
VAIIYISHRLEELKRVADRIVVLRDGKLVCNDDIGRYSTEQLVQLMAGELTKVDLDAEHRRIGAPLLRMRGLGRAPWCSRPAWRCMPVKCWASPA